MDNWQALGPVSAGSVVCAVVISPAYEQDHTIYIGTSEGLFRSDDAGRHWSYATAGLSVFQVQALAISPQFERDGTILAGGNGPGILRSTDGGASWDLASVDSQWQPIVTAIALSPTFGRDGIALIGTLEDGIFRSTDHGRSWRAANFGLLSLGVLAIAMSPAMPTDRRAYVITEDGLYYSPNEGRAWKAILSATSEDIPALALLLSPTFGQDGVLYAGAEEAGVWRSADRGRGWEALPELTDRTVNALCFSSSPGSSRYLYAGTAEGEIFRSSDEGRTWQCSIDSIPSVLALSSQGSLIVAGLYDRVLALWE